MKLPWPRPHPFRHRPPGRARAAAGRGVAGRASRLRLHDRRAADHRRRADDARLDRPAHSAFRRAADARHRPRLLRGRPGAASTLPRACRSSAARAICGELAEFFGQQPARRQTTAATTSRSWPRSTTPRGCRWPTFCARPTSCAADGADLIDVGCDPGEPWTGVGECVRALKAEGHRVSIDSLQPGAKSRRPCGRRGAGAERQRDQSRRGAATGAAKSSSFPTISPRSAAWTKRSSCSPPRACRCGSIRCSSRSAAASPPAWAATSKSAAAIPTPKC